MPNSPEKVIMLGMVSSKRKQVLQKAQWLDTIKANTSQSIKQLEEVIQNQKKWMVHRIAENQT